MICYHLLFLFRNLLLTSLSLILEGRSMVVKVEVGSTFYSYFLHLVLITPQSFSRASKGRSIVKQNTATIIARQMMAVNSNIIKSNMWLMTGTF